MHRLAGRDRGSALVIACVLIILVMGMATSLLKAAATNKKSTITWMGGQYTTMTRTFAPGNQVFGSCVAPEFGPASNFRVHYDQNLGSVGGAPTCKMTAWYENPADP